ncbi:MAG TPA: hypothetical protein ENJ37_03430 [Deltaproteobacteria bacterium]|nr:hypothetical protein [Deltaproteobacteria bacterium]
MRFRYLVAAAITIALAASACTSEKAREAAVEEETVSGTASMEGLPEGHPSIDTSVDPGAASFMKQAGKDGSVSHSGLRTQKQVRVSDEIKAKWKEVTLEVFDTSDSTKAVSKFRIGSKTKIDGGELVVEAFVPDYSIYDDHIGSKSAELVNPAVLVELFEDGKSVAKGWVFNKYPEFNSFKHDKLRISLVAPGGERQQRQEASE